MDRKYGRMAAGMVQCKAILIGCNPCIVFKLFFCHCPACIPQIFCSRYFCPLFWDFDDSFQFLQCQHTDRLSDGLHCLPHFHTGLFSCTAQAVKNSSQRTRFFYGAENSFLLPVLRFIFL